MDDTEIIATSPPNTSGTIDITIITTNGETSPNNNTKFTYNSGPVITSVLPNSGSINGGVIITINGTGLLNTTNVSFGTNLPAVILDNEDTILNVLSPSSDLSGIVDIQIITPYGTSSINQNDQFEYIEPNLLIPSIFSVYPNRGSSLGGTFVSISGENFIFDNFTNVYFGINLATNVNVVSNNLITCYSPEGTQIISGNPFHITVSNSNGTSVQNTNDEFTYEIGNIIVSDTSYNGKLYAIYAAGGFKIEQGFPSIYLAPQTPITEYDVTNALQVSYDVRLLNYKIGILKDSSNQYIIDSSFNTRTNRFPVDSITITSTEFVNNMSTNQVLSVGTYSTLYSSFSNYVNAYFSYAGGFETLFSNISYYDINNGVFDANSFINIITESIDISGAYVSALQGSVQINNINNILRYAIDTNVFGNRNPQTGTTASDPNNSANYGMADGFLAGDFIMIPTGTQITLQLVIQLENYLPINNKGPINVNSDNTDFTYKYNNSLYTQTTTATLTDIKRVLTAPLLLRLDNLSY